MLLVYIKLASAEDNGVVLLNPLTRLTQPTRSHSPSHPCRPAYLEAWRQLVENTGNVWRQLVEKNGSFPVTFPTS